MKNKVYKFIIALVCIVSFIQLVSLTDSFILNAEYLKEPQEAPRPTASVQSVSTSAPEFTPQRIVIKKVNIDLPVVSQPLQNGTWQVDSTRANFAEGTSLVSAKKGNTGIFAHDRKGLFADIKDLKPGDKIEVFGPNYKAEYQVNKAQIVDPKRVTVFESTGNSMLTLLTCDGIFSNQRFVVTAQLLGITKS